MQILTVVERLTRQGDAETSYLHFQVQGLDSASTELLDLTTAGESGGGARLERSGAREDSADIRGKMRFFREYVYSFQRGALRCRLNVFGKYLPPSHVTFLMFRLEKNETKIVDVRFRF